MGYRQSRIRRISAFVLALFTLVATVALAAPGVAAYPAADGPQLVVDRIVVPPGTPVTVTLNGFPTMQSIVLHVHASLLGDQGGNSLAFPGTTDATGSASVIIPTTGFILGNYIVSATVDGSSSDLDGVLAGFAIVDVGFTGPRIVPAVPPSLDDQG